MSAVSTWIVRAEWVNSSPTYHGPFVYAYDAEQWAERILGADEACERFELGLITPAAVTA